MPVSLIRVSAAISHPVHVESVDVLLRLVRAVVRLLGIVSENSVEYDFGRSHGVTVSGLAVVAVVVIAVVVVVVVAVVVVVVVDDVLEASGDGSPLVPRLFGRFLPSGSVGGFHPADDPVLVIVVVVVVPRGLSVLRTPVVVVSALADRGISGGTPGPVIVVVAAGPIMVVRALTWIRISGGS